MQQVTESRKRKIGDDSRGGFATLQGAPNNVVASAVLLFGIRGFQRRSLENG
jgi:hypothetical protein